MAVKHLGHDVVLVENGVQALDTLRADRFDLVLLDILMPQMDGYDVLAEMKDDPSLRDIPVIVISALEELQSVVTCIERGAEDYLPKDFDPVLLRARINACLEKKRLRDAVLKQLDFIRDMFGKYVPETVATAIMDTGGSIRPNRTQATVLFTDIAGFTGIVEKMSPEQAFEMLNEYFPAVIEPISHYGGVVNQFQGDAMLVTFNVPMNDPAHADNAVNAALAILKVTETKTFAGMKLQTRIGINSGEVIAGNVGSGKRFNYTVHGDSVNLAARLEQLNKHYGTRALVSGNTAHRLVGDYALNLLGDVTIRGTETSVQVNELIAP